MGNSRINPRYLDPVFLILVIAALFLFKLPQLSLPCFWDEAWSYLPAILRMADAGPSLLPDPQYAELTRGHPLLFYFITSLWIKIFGVSFPALRTLPLIISALLLTVQFLVSGKHFGRAVAYLSTILLLIQSVFLAQSSLLLPEMLLALFSLLTLHAFISGRKKWFLLWGTLLLLTKETGVVLMMLCLLIHLFRFIGDRGRAPFISWIKSSFWLMVPFLIIALFYTAQRLINGWFFFPEHISLISFSIGSVLANLKGYSFFLFLGSGRNLLTFFVIAAALYILVRKIPLDSAEKKASFIFLLFLVAYVLSLSFNFYSPRYLLSVLPPFMQVCAFFLVRATGRYKFIRIAAFLAIFANNIWFTWHQRSDADHNLGYADAVQAHWDLIVYGESLRWQDKPVATHFLMRFYLSRPEAGYVQPGRECLRLSEHISDSTAFAVISSTEYSPAFREEINDHQGILLKRFEKNKSWTEVYRVN